MVVYVFIKLLNFVGYILNDFFLSRIRELGRMYEKKKINVKYFLEVIRDVYNNS